MLLPAAADADPTATDPACSVRRPPSPNLVAATVADYLRTPPAADLERHCGFDADNLMVG